MSTCSNRCCSLPRSRASLVAIARSCVVVLLLFTLVTSGKPASAQPKLNRFITLSERVPVSGDVQAVYLVVAGEKELLHSGAASWVQAAEGNEISCIGRFSLPSEEDRLGVLFVVLGTQGEVRSVYRSVKTSELTPTAYLTATELRERLVERRSLLRQLDSEVRLQEERIDTLQEDADAIANVARIVNVEDELDEVKRKIHAIDRASSSIQRRKLQMQQRPAPLNAQTREAELVKQLAELSTALSATETSALKRVSSASGELQQKLQLIEDTRDEHITLLEEELLELQRRRKR